MEFLKPPGHLKEKKRHMVHTHAYTEKKDRFEENYMSFCRGQHLNLYFLNCHQNCIFTCQHQHRKNTDTFLFHKKEVRVLGTNELLKNMQQHRNICQPT